MDVDSGGDNPPDEFSNINTQSIAKQKIKYSFQRTDLGPYIIYIQANEELGKNLGNFNHLSIAKEIFDLQLDDLKKIEKKGKNRVGAEFKNYLAANNFLNNQNLINKGYNMFIPANLVTCRGIVKFVNKRFSDEDILKYAKVNNGKILNVRRLNRRAVNENGETIFVPTGTILFTFSGKIIPKYVNICLMSMPVETYKPPITQCYNCFRFGHTQKQCRGKTKCINCSESHDEPCTNGQKCINCKSADHQSVNKKCPEFARQQAIREKMALENISYFDANQMIKNKITTTPQIHPLEFPPLRDLSNPISPTMNRDSFNFTGRNKSFSTVAKTPKKRRIIQQGGYNKTLHNECLISPNARETLNSPNASPMFVQSPCSTASASDDSKQGISFIIETLGSLSKEKINEIIKFIQILESAGPIQKIDRDRPKSTPDDDIF